MKNRGEIYYYYLLLAYLTADLTAEWFLYEVSTLIFSSVFSSVSQY